MMASLRSNQAVNKMTAFVNQHAGIIAEVGIGAGIGALTGPHYFRRKNAPPGDKQRLIGATEGAAEGLIANLVWKGLNGK